jgi:hypothetical protein
MKYLSKSVYRILVLGMILLILFRFNSPGMAQTASPALVRIAPSQAQVLVGQTVDIGVEIQNVEGLYGIDLLLAFDPQALEVVDMDPELEGIQVQLGTFLEPGFVLVNIADNQVGRLRLAMTQLSPAAPKSGSGVLIVIRLKGLALKADTDLSLVSAKFASATGSYIDIPETQIEDGRLSVVPEIQGPTNTPIPAQPAGTPMPTATKAPGSNLQPTPTSFLLFVQPTTTLILPGMGATQAAPLVSEATAAPADAPTQTPTAVPTDNPTATLALATPALDATAAALNAQEAGSAALTQTVTGAELPAKSTAMAANAAPEEPQRRIFSGGANPNDNSASDAGGINPVWPLAAALLLGGLGWFAWKRTRREDR